MVVPILSEHVTQIAAETASRTLVNLLKSDLPRKKLSELKFLVEKGLPTYLRAQSYRCERVKTLLSRNDPVLVRESYVSPDFEVKQKKYSSHEFLDHVSKQSNAMIVSGLAGSGKSTFLKYTFTEVIERGDTYYPIFLELRKINTEKSTEKLLFDGLLRSVQEFCPDFTKHLLEFGLKRGAYYLLLDGYDELDPDVRDKISDEIEHFAAVYQDCKILMTSRPSKDFESWSSFEFATLQPFSLEQSIEYVQKLPYDVDQKAAFIVGLSESLFEQNKAFLSNPLLTAMMLFTYSAYGEIPNKRHVFYEKCFDVLAREHDTLKGRYQRELFSGLTLEQLEKVFTFVCVLSYRKRKFRFGHNDLSSTIESAQKAASVNASAEDLIRDFSESISILIKDGQEYEFIHRSFQEYFYAKFVVEERKLKLSDKLSGLIKQHLDDDAIDMIIDMDVAYFEEEYLLPELKKLQRSIKDTDPLDNPAGILSKCFTRLSINEPIGNREAGLSLTITEDNTNFFLMNQAVSRRYCDFLGVSRSDFWPPIEDRDDTIRKLKESFGGEIKIHYTNNSRLRELGFGPVAKSRKDAVDGLIQLLERRKNDRSDVMLEAFDAKYLS